jgi:hypothetical protein
MRNHGGHGGHGEHGVHWSPRQLCLISSEAILGSPQGWGQSLRE